MFFFVVFVFVFVFFFFQAEDGIRDHCVTGVQTCALPIWNSANSFIFYGKSGEIATNRLSDQELAVLSLHLLQISLVYVNTLMIQEVLSQSKWMKLMKEEDLRALSPLIWGHVNPYGTFRLDLNERLPIETG